MLTFPLLIWLSLAYLFFIIIMHPSYFYFSHCLQSILLFSGECTLRFSLLPPSSQGFWGFFGQFCFKALKNFQCESVVAVFLHLQNPNTAGAIPI